MELSNTHLLTVESEGMFVSTLEDDRPGIASAEIAEFINGDLTYTPLQGRSNTEINSKIALTEEVGGKTIIFRDYRGNIRREVHVPSDIYLKDMYK